MNKQRIRAFTLLECLLGLFILTLVLHLVIGMGRTSARMEQRWGNLEEKSWYLFLNQLDEELRFARNFSIVDNGNELQYDYFPYPEEEITRFAHYYFPTRQQIVRTRIDEAGRKRGYMPALDEVTSIEFSLNNSRIYLIANFVSGAQKIASWHQEEREWRKED